VVGSQGRGVKGEGGGEEGWDGKEEVGWERGGG